MKNIKQNLPHLTSRRVWAFALSMAIVLGLFVGSGVVTIATSATEAPDVDRLYAYRTKPSAVYVATSVMLDKNATYRVYADSAHQSLLGAAYSNVYSSSYCVITMPGQMSNGQTVYVTRQEDGAAESAHTAVAFQYTPSITLQMREIKTSTDAIPEIQSGSDSPNFYGNLVLKAPGNLKTLTAGKYYQVELLLTKFTAIDSVLIPLRYNTEYLKPAAITTKSGTKYLAAPVDSAITSAASGLRFDMGSATAAKYGVLQGTAFSNWATGASFSGSAGGTYQYINTSTGLFKLQAGTGQSGSIAAFGVETGSNATQFVRFYFQATQTVSISELPVWIATEADCPAGVTEAVAATYYDLESPHGILPSLCGVNVMAPPPVLETMETSTAVQLSAGVSSYSAMSTLDALSADLVKVYNYTNWSNIDDTYSGLYTLDGKVGAYDRLVIPAGCSTILNGDTVRVYKELPVTKDSEYKEGVYSSNYGVEVNLGYRFLEQNGGTLYISVLRPDSSGNWGYQSNAADCPVTYPGEASRDVTFRIYRSSWEDESRASEKYTPSGATGTKTGTPLADVEMGEHLQIRVYFNNFYELMSYGFAIHFDPTQVQVVDVDYGEVATGTVYEQDYQNEESCFSVGKDLANVTLREQAIYQAWQDGDEDEIASMMTIWGISTRAEFDQIAADVQVKYDLGVTEDGTGTLPWKGGLLFNDQAGESGFPYVDNANGTVRFVSTALQQTPLTLQRTAGGYHFLSINFAAQFSGDPGFRLAEDGDAGYELLPGQQIALVGGVTGLKVNTAWEVWPMGNRIEMNLRNGNALAADNDLLAEYLYDGSAYRDPGYEVRRADGSRVDIGDITRYCAACTVDGDEVLLEASETAEGEVTEHALVYSDGEALDVFRVKPGKYSAHYVLHYKYVTQDGTQTVQAERNIYIIYKKGDVNRDGEIDLFDEQALADHLNTAALSTNPLLGNGVTLLCADPAAEPTYALYEAKTADIYRDGQISVADRDALRDYSLGLATIEQDYSMPVS